MQSEEREKERWVTYAWRLLVFTVVYNIVEGVVSVYWGFDDQSVSLFGFGLDSMIEVLSSLIVLWHMHHELGINLNAEKLIRNKQEMNAATVAKSAVFSLDAERKATLTIGVLLCLLAASAVTGGTIRLATKSGPKSTMVGILISSLSLSFMFFLWYFKTKAAVILNSSTLTSDANCSLGCIKLSTILLAGSLLYFLTNQLWWADAATAILIGLMVCHEGYSTVKEAMSRSFSGGCGCCSGSDTWLARQLREKMQKETITDRRKMSKVSDESSEDETCKDGCCGGSRKIEVTDLDGCTLKDCCDGSDDQCCNDEGSCSEECCAGTTESQSIEVD